MEVKKMKNIFKKIIFNKLSKKIFYFFIEQLIKDDSTHFLQMHNLLLENESNRAKKSLIKKMERFGPNSFLWGNTHKISCPQKMIVGENVHIGDNSYIRAEGGVFIGDNTHISRNVVIYSLNHDYKGENLPYDENFLYKPVKIGRNVWIGMNVCIVPGTIIGNGAIIGMGTSVSGEVPACTIIGSQKWNEIGKRDVIHYENLDKLGRYGAANGFFYNYLDKLFKKMGDKKNSRRSILEVIEYPDCGIALKKTFLNTKDAFIAFNKEKKASEILKNNKWFPHVYEIGENFIVYEFIDNDLRLDRSISNYNSIEKGEILSQIIKVLLDLFLKNVSHRDFHARNLFYSKETGIKLIDFESMEEEILEDVNFFKSYDIIGIGLDSPFYTNNMCVFSDSKISISKIFEIKNIEDFEIKVKNFLCDSLYDISSSFYTRRYSYKERHTLRNRYIYNTFDLPYLKITRKIGQRDIKKRLKRFGIDKSKINKKRILDIGSNIGGILLELSKMNPLEGLGLEYDNDKVEISNLIAKIHNIKNIKFKKMDVESVFFYQDFTEKYDIVFCLAVIEHLKDKKRFMSKLREICLDTLYLEGNGNSNIKETYKLLTNSGFSQVKYIGISNDEKNAYNNNRPLYICK